MTVISEYIDSNIVSHDEPRPQPQHRGCAATLQNVASPNVCYVSGLM